MIDPIRFAQSLESLNPQQHEAVVCDRNCVVTAGAGSGKTTVLAHRFLRLVVEGKAHVDEILTLTFSRLAAAEMFERIHARLHAYRDDPDIKEELKRLGKATITTIDAFCNRIVSSDPLRYGIGPDFTMDEEASRSMAAECARQVCLEMADHPGLVFLASLHGPEELIDSLFVGLAVSRFHPSTCFDAPKSAMIVISWIEELLRTEVDRIIEAYRIISRCEGTGKLLQDLKEEAAEVLALGTLSDVCAESHQVLTRLERVKAKRVRGKQDFVELCNAQVEIVSRSLPLARGACAALLDQAVIADVYQVLARLHAAYLAMKRERGVLTFGDIAHMARDILLRNTQVRRHYQQRFRYIMIDEFQDTNRLQKDLVYLLAESPFSSAEGVPDASQLQEDKLFFVGDEKQSIYRFRGADVRVFKQLDKEITAAGGKRIVLETNYRSEPQLIDLYNTLFSRVMGDASLSHEATFQPLSPRAPKPGVTARMCLLYKSKSEKVAPAEDEEEQEAEAVQEEAYAIANLIDRMTGTDAYLVPDKDGAVRRPRYEDIAILFRTSGNQMHYEKALRIAGIPYRLGAVQSLFLEAPANDLYLFLQLVVHPDDTLAFAGVLRSPFCRLSDDVLPLALERMEQPFPPLDDLDIDAEDRQKYHNCADLYRNLCERASSSTVAALVSYLWHEGGYRYHLLSDPLFQVYLEHLAYLLELAIGFDNRNLGLNDYLDFLRPRLGQRENLSDVEPLRTEVPGVRIMTIHKSKGLEFPIVILASMGSASKAMVTPAWHDVAYADDAIPVPRHMRPYEAMGNILFERDKQLLLGMESAEMKRLFYVALTRAQTHLVLSGCVNAQNMGEKSVDRNFLALFEYHTGILGDPHALGPSFTVEKIESAPVSILRASVPRHLVDARVRKMAPLYERPLSQRVALPVSIAVTSLCRSDFSGLESQVERLSATEADPIIEREGLERAFGTWCHAIVERMLMHGSQQECSDVATLVAPKEIEDAPLSVEEQAVLSRSAESLANKFLCSEVLQEIRFRSPLALESEVRFSMRLEGENAHVVNGAIDLLIRYAHEVRILDFKTDLLRVPALHEKQLSIYREAARRLYGLPVSSAVCYLRDVGHLEWVTTA